MNKTLFIPPSDSPFYHTMSRVFPITYTMADSHMLSLHLMGGNALTTPRKMQIEHGCLFSMRLIKEKKKSRPNHTVRNLARLLASHASRCWDVNRHYPSHVLPEGSLTLIHLQSFFFSFCSKKKALLVGARRKRRRRMVSW